MGCVRLHIVMSHGFSLFFLHPMQRTNFNHLSSTVHTRLVHSTHLCL